ncbi:DNA-binding response OmpR family regulator [Roseivirga pacifica]|jgi:two-component system, OmpR family, response regulator VicR|uniref:DNA-binding response regulator, OmpR family, contains REC and winged-helix (WHTH) domain n=1 Tax=Roseivirga pacifica TaxID=1267423 RepID=A0A1I0MK95_9BACT|nr:response regulator transcription factor [Roseivirga pacifica]MCO6358977.1 response regulator [Roseivirga pacifica]MCO6365387.1 response regulator [Roseivirga pacifica]MCO6371883.1 response regulator [Roseivirga pacifica]MCO6376006.1 response regulator [Roseivirga pacifica]MCO6379261.1 response regulator [Roseivirga pacifica]
MASFKILLVEDDPNLGQILHEYLSVKGYETKLCRDGEEGLRAFKSDPYDLCLFDVMLPKKDGFSMAKEIRKNDSVTPIIFLTAKSMKEDTIEGFKIGGDDYITKPFSMEELLLRIQAILRRTAEKNPQISDQKEFEFGSFHFDYDKQVLSQSGNQTKLTSKESELLRLLCLHINQPLDRSTALKIIWRDDSYFNARSMDVYIAKLRKHLKVDETVQIMTLHGSGFKLITDAQAG